MIEEQKEEISNKSSEQKSEKRKKKKRRGKTSQSAENNEQSNPQQEAPLTTISSIITDENSKLPINNNNIPSKNSSNETSNQDISNNEQQVTKLRKRKKEKSEEEEERENKELSDNLPKARTMVSVNEQITSKPEQLDPDLDNNTNERTKSEVLVKNKKNIFIKRANFVENEENSKKLKNNGIIPTKDINPNELIEIDEEDGELNYLEAEKAYELSVFLDSHKFITTNKKFDKKFIELVKRKIIRYEKNLLDISENNKFFILYELQVSEYTDLCLSDIATLNAIKSIFISFPSIHLIIILSDEEFYNKYSDKYDYSLINDFAKEKLANILIYLDLDTDSQKRIHAFSAKKFKTKNNEFESEKNKIKEILDKPKLRKLFNLTTKEEEKNDSLLEYPCYLAIAANPSIYTKYIPEITSDYRCLIINSIFFMNRYQLCFDASKILSFNEPSIIALKIVPPLIGVNGREAYADIDEKNTIFSSDDKILLNKKIMELAYGDPNGNNPNVDVACQYLGFLEEYNDNYNDLIKRFEEGKIDNGEIKNKVFNLLQDVFQNFREKDINNIDTDKIMI